MKKTCMTMLLAALCISMTACSETKDKPAETTAAVTAAETTAAASETTAAASASEAASAENGTVLTAASDTAETTAAADTETMPAKTVMKVSPEDAAVPASPQIAGEWRYNETKKNTVQIGEFVVNADGTFYHYSVLNDEIQGTLGTGKVTIADGQYVFTYDDGTPVLKAKPSERDPLNVLTESAERELVRCEEDVMAYDRSYTPVTELPKDKTGVIGIEKIEGVWSCGEELRLTVSGSGLNGTFEYQRFIQNASEPASTANYEAKGRVVVEQGTDNAGKQAYYYNCYQDDKLIVSLDAESMQGEDVKEIGAAYLDDDPQWTPVLTMGETKQENAS